MSHRSSWMLPGILTVLLLCGVPLAQATHADPPDRVAYLSDSRGQITYSPAGEDQWVGLERNRPLIRGDRLWSDRDSRVEVQIGSAALRLGSYSGVEILDLGDQSAQLQLTEGSLNLRIRRLQRGETFEIATPMLAFVINRAGRYRIDVDAYESTTSIVVWEGEGEAYGENGSFPLQSGDSATFYDNDLRDYQLSALPAEDQFDRYCRDRDYRLDRSSSLHYVGDDLAGYSQLDDYGRWRRMGDYGDVWFPSQVSVSWAPYRDGHWVWQEPWGWTWIDNAPWGFAPSHYGRWVSISDRWGWIPGPRNVRPVYAPALVAFIGGRNWSLSVSLGGSSSPIGWFPLGPREVYVPSYTASRDYFTRVNVNNTVINNTVINNYYGSYSRGETQIGRTEYANRSVRNSITAVPQSVFVNAQPVRTARIELDRRARSSGEVSRVAQIAPSLTSVLGNSGRAASPPPRGNFDRTALARTPPPQRELPFAQRERQLQSKPGQAVEATATATDQARAAQRERRIQLINERQAATNLRETQSRRAGSGQPAKPEPGQPQPQRNSDRSQGERNEGGRDRRTDETTAPVSGRSPPRVDRGNARNAESKPQPQPQPQPQPRSEPQQAPPQPQRGAAEQRREDARQQEQTRRAQDQARERAIEAGAAEQNRIQADRARQAEAQGEREAAAERSREQSRRDQSDARNRQTPPPQRPVAAPPEVAAPAVPPPPRGDASERGRAMDKPTANDERRGRNADKGDDKDDHDGKPGKDQGNDKDDKDKDDNKRDREG